MPSANTILIIDDEPMLCRSLALILQQAGYAAKSAQTAREALRLLNQEVYDLVFLDIQLPDQSGIELLPQIRELHPEMPVLILTAHATLETAIDAVRAGARDYLLKPIEPEDILVRVKKILEETRQPKRQREIVTQLQSLLSELTQSGELETAPAALEPVPAPVDPDRFIIRGPLMLDLHTHHVLFDNRSLALPPSTFAYLVTLARHVPKPVSYEVLVMESQGYKSLSRLEAREMTRWQIHEIRKVLEVDSRHPQMIITVRDIGYRLVV